MSKILKLAHTQDICDHPIILKMSCHRSRLPWANLGGSLRRYSQQIGEPCPTMHTCMPAGCTIKLIFWLCLGCTGGPRKSRNKCLLRIPRTTTTTASHLRINQSHPDIKDLDVALDTLVAAVAVAFGLHLNFWTQITRGLPCLRARLSTKKHKKKKKLDRVSPLHLFNNPRSNLFPDLATFDTGQLKKPWLHSPETIEKSVRCGHRDYEDNQSHLAKKMHLNNIFTSMT